MIRVTVWFDVETNSAAEARHVVRALINKLATDDEIIEDYGIEAAEAKPNG